MKPEPAFDVILTCNYSPWSDYTGGGQKSVHMLAMAMAAEGRRVCAVYSKSPWEKIAVPAGLPYTVKWAWFIGIVPGISSPLRFLNGIPFLIKVAALSSPRTLLIGNGDEASLLWMIRSRRLFVYSARNTYEDYLRGRDWTRGYNWIRALFREPRDVAVALAVRRADVVACTSGFSLGQLRQCFGLKEARCAVIPNGLDPHFFTLEFHERGQTGVFFFGRLAANKGPQLAWEAYSRLPAEVRRIHPITFAGDGPLKGKLQKASRDAGMNGNAAFPGWLESGPLSQAMLSSRLVVLPSLEESFGNAILETLATGQNLVSTTACAIPEVAGPYATLVAPGDAAALAEAMGRELARVRGAEEIDLQRRYFRERFSWPASARLYLELTGR